MAKTTAISWCDHTCNFWIGCTKVSTEAGGGGACDHCYAEARDKRFAGGAHWGPGAPRQPRLERAAKEMVAFNRAAKRDGVRRAVFVNNLSDFFDNEVPQAWRDFAFGVFAGCDSLDILLLTKRVGLVMGMVPPTWRIHFPTHVHIGITVCNQGEYDRDIDKLMAVPAHRRYLSLEPLLGPMDLGLSRTPALWTITHPDEKREREPTDRPWKLHLVIVGGESGAHARPMHPGWARSIRDQCEDFGVDFHFKQWGGRSPKANGHLLDGVEHRAFPKTLLQQDSCSTTTTKG